MSRIIWLAVVAMGVFVLQSTASACPMCANAVAEGQNQSQAFYYSILFMLSMPFLLLGAFGAAFYRLSRLDVQSTDAEQ